MITEIAQIDVKPGTEKDFEAAVAKARPLFLRAKGGKGFELHKSIEKPQRYRLMAQWETLENHTVDFRGSEDFTAWRGLVGQYFAAPPEVEHTETDRNQKRGGGRNTQRRGLNFGGQHELSRRGPAENEEEGGGGRPPPRGD